MADTVSPFCSFSFTTTACLSLESTDGLSRSLPECLCAGEALLGALDKQIALRLVNCIDGIHGHFACSASEINPAKSEAMDADAYLFEFSNCCADVNGITSQPVEFGDDQNVPPWPSAT